MTGLRILFPHPQGDVADNPSAERRGDGKEHKTGHSLPSVPINNGLYANGRFYGRMQATRLYLSCYPGRPVLLPEPV